MGIRSTNIDQIIQSTTSLETRLHFGAAIKSYLNILNSTYHQDPRCVLGAFRKSPVKSLYREANETPSYLRHTKLTLQYYVKLKQCPQKSSWQQYFELDYYELFWQKNNAIQHYEFRMKSIVKVLGSTLRNIQETTAVSIPSWSISQLRFLLELHNLPKEKPHPLTFQDYVSGYIGKIP